MASYGNLDDGYGRGRFRRGYGVYYMPSPPTSIPYMLVMPLEPSTGQYGTSQYNTTWYGNAIPLNACQSFGSEAAIINREGTEAIKTRRCLLIIMPLIWLAIWIVDLYFWIDYINAPYYDEPSLVIPLMITAVALVFWIFVGICIRLTTQQKFENCMRRLNELAQRENSRLANTGCYWAIGPFGRWLEFHVPAQAAIPVNNYTAVDAAGNPVLNAAGGGVQQNANYYNPQYFVGNQNQASGPQMNGNFQTVGYPNPGIVQGTVAGGN